MIAARTWKEKLADRLLIYAAQLLWRYHPKRGFEIKKHYEGVLGLTKIEIIVKDSA